MCEPEETKNYKTKSEPLCVKDFAVITKKNINKTTQVKKTQTKLKR